MNKEELKKDIRKVEETESIFMCLFVSFCLGGLLIFKENYFIGIFIALFFLITSIHSSIVIHLKTKRLKNE